MRLLEAENLCVRYGSTEILRDVSFGVESGAWLMLIGPNGAGKSTLISAVSQSVAYSGSVRCMGEDARLCKSALRAKRMGVLQQNHFVGYSFTVREVVRLGRYAYAPGPFSNKREDDEARVYEALRMTGMQDKAEQSVLTLSGGELQRTFLAQLFAQDPKLLLLDEPANHLDLVYQREIFSLLAKWRKAETGRAILSVVHDLSLARAYGTDALLLHEGRALASGGIEDVFAPAHLQRAYSMDVYAWMQGLLRQWSAGRDR